MDTPIKTLHQIQFCNPPIQVFDCPIVVLPSGRESSAGMNFLFYVHSSMTIIKNSN